MKGIIEDENSIESEGRRKAVKTIVGGVAALAAYNLMPAKWGTPVIESVFMPAHAATSGASINDPCTVTRLDGTTDSTSVQVRVNGFVTPPTGGLPTTITATPVGAGSPQVATTTTLADGTYEATFTIGGGPNITRVNVVTTVEGVPGSASCSVDIPAPGSSCCGATGTMTIDGGVGNVSVQYTTCSGATTIGPFNTPGDVSIPDVDITQSIRITGNNINDMISTNNISFTFQAGEPGYFEGTVTSCGPFSFTVQAVA